MDEKIEINSGSRDAFANLLFRDKILPTVLAHMGKDVDENGDYRVSRADFERRLEELYGQEFKDLGKIYSAFGGKPIELSPKDIATKFHRARIPLGQGKYAHASFDGRDIVVNTNDRTDVSDPTTISGVPQYNEFEPDTYYGTRFGDGLSIDVYTDGHGRLGENPGFGLQMESIPSVIEGLNRAAKGRSLKEKPDAAMSIVSDFIPGNTKSKSSKLTVKTPHDLNPSVTIKRGENPTISAINYKPQGNSHLHFDTTSWPGNSFVSDVPEGYEDRVVLGSIEDVRRFLRGSGESHKNVSLIREELAKNLRFKDNIDLSGMPKSPDELHEMEVKEIDKTQVPSKEELTKDLEKINESSRMYNHSILRNAFRKSNTTQNFSDELDELMIQTKFHDHNSTGRKVKDALWGFVPFGPSAVAGNNKRIAGWGTAIAASPLHLVPLVGSASHFYYGKHKVPRQLRADMQGLDNPKVRKKLKQLYEEGIDEIEAKKLAKMLKMNPKKLFKQKWSDSVETAVRNTLGDVPDSK